MIESSCHCGSVKLKISAELPASLLSCNCSICRKYGGLMTYFPKDVVDFLYEPEAAFKYIWGDKRIAFVNCKTCACFSHWEGLTPENGNRVGVNGRLFENVELEGIPIRRFDGADTWTFLD